ncbi:SAM-dependent methyltransferase [Streptomyces sp. NPDC001910]|uniref:class I SAM-dependent methyltransferase n=1 Tax=Streptomyces sp. NPDC001910 TaxID=3154403 RepID=UPI003324B242
MRQDVSAIDAIGRTAFAVAALRAAEHRRTDRLFSDPWAEQFLRAAGEVLGPPEATEDFAALMRTQAAVRSRFFDDHLVGATERGVRQVVLVASGMDSRPWRLHWPEATTVFDLDQAPVLRFKDEAMEGRVAHTAATRRAVAADLREDWASCLHAAGFRDDRPTAWLLEGILYALNEKAAEGLLADLTRLSAPGSTLAFDHFEVGPSLRAATDRLGADLSRLWQSGPTDPAAWLSHHGWQPEVRELANVAACFGRTPHHAYDAGPGAEGHSWLAVAIRPPAPATG